MTETRRIEKLRRDHPVESSDCGREELNRYLIRYAWQNQQAGAAQSYVGMVGEVIAGYYTLAVGQVTLENAPERLAVDHRWQGQGVGKALLRDAMQRTLQAADIAGIRAFAAHAKDDEARRFYEHFDFIPSPTDPMHLFVLRGGLSRNQDLHKTLNQHFAAKRSLMRVSFSGSRGSSPTLSLRINERSA